MATQPTHPTPPPKPANHQPPPPPPKHEAAKPSTREPHRDEPPLPIGAKPTDPHDPQAQKFDPPPGPPFYEQPRDRRDNPHERPDFTPKAAVDPRAEKPPQGFYADGMTIADEQRARSAWIEQHGDAAYKDETDQRPADERPVFDKNALAGGGAFVSQGGKKQIPGVTPPTKRE